MASSRLAQVQLKAFSDCLHGIYGTPTGDDPVPGILANVQDLVRINSVAVDEFKSENGKLVAHQHITSRGFEGHPEVAVIPRLVAKDHPMIRHAMRTGKQEPLRMSDFVSQRQLKALSIYDFNSRIHEWRDQVSLAAKVAGGTLSITLNRDRQFTDEEFFMLDLLLPHLKRVINRCALFKRLPGNEQLTPREREVLFWMTRGKRDEEIATIVGCGLRTVSQHVRKILAKLGAENRTSAVTMVLGGEAVEG